VLFKTSGKGYKYVTVCDKVAHWYAGLYRRDSARPITTWKTRQTVSIICLFDELAHRLMAHRLGGP